MLSSHSKPFDHISYGYENILFEKSPKKLDFWHIFGAFLACVQKDAKNRQKSTFFGDFSKKYFHNRMRYDQTVYDGKKACDELHFPTI